MTRRQRRQWRYWHRHFVAHYPPLQTYWLNWRRWR